MGGRRGVQQRIPLGVTVVIGCKIFLLDGNRFTVAIIRNTVTILRAIGNSAKGGIICCVLIYQNSELTIAKVQVLFFANYQNTRNRPIRIAYNTVPVIGCFGIMSSSINARLGICSPNIVFVNIRIIPLNPCC